jgi:homoaconitase/3-isopropylmalate dehydratase large subunit
MTETKIKEAAQAIKEHLIQLAVDDKLPLDMTQLDETFIVDIIGQHQPTEKEKAIAEAEHYLSDSHLSIREQVEAIAKQAEEDGLVMIDDVEGVLVWEPVEGIFYCDEFLQLIGWDLI